MIKVLHIVHNLSKNSGITTLLLNMYDNIDKSKISFDFCLYLMQDENSANKYFEDNGCKVFQVEYPNIHGCKKFITQLSKILQDGDYNVVHLHSPILHHFVRRAINDCGKSIKLFIHSHGSKLSDKKLNAMRNRVVCLGVNKNADLRLACSDIAGKCLFGNKEFELIVNGVNSAKFKFDKNIRSAMRQKYNINDDQLVLIHSGRFNEQKNHNKLIHIFKSLHQSQNNSHLFLLGDGPLKPSIEKLVVDFNLSDCVHFVGFTNNVTDYLSMADVFLFPSLFEGLAYTLVEAQFNGLVCVVSSTCSKQSKISNYLHFVPLRAKNSEWVSEILRCAKEKQRDEINCDKSFEICNSVKKLTDLYEKHGVK